MQIKFKKQIDIELDRSDLLEAVRDLLAKHGQVISDAELEEVKFINSPQTGIRATLKVTEESVDTASVVNGTPTDVVKADVAANPVTSLGNAVTVVNGTLTTQGTKELDLKNSESGEDPEPEVEEEPVPPNTVEDVMPSIDDVKGMVEDAPEEAPAADSSSVPSADAIRTSLF